MALVWDDAPTQATERLVWDDAPQRIPVLAAGLVGAERELTAPFRTAARIQPQDLLLGAPYAYLKAALRPQEPSPIDEFAVEAARQHPVASGGGHVAGFLPSFVASGGPVRAALKGIPMLGRLAAGGRGSQAALEGLRQGGQFGLAELLQGRPESALSSAGIGTTLGPISTIRRFLPRVGAGALTMGGLSAAMAPQGQRTLAGAFGGGLGAFASLLPAHLRLPTTPRRAPRVAPESYLLSPRLAFPEEFTLQAAEQAAREGAQEMLARQPLRTADLYRARSGEQAFPKRA